MSRRALLLVLAILAASLPATPTDAQSCTPAAIVLSGGTTTGHCAIQDAIDAAVPHDTVLVLETTIGHLGALVVPVTLHNLTLCATNTAQDGCGADHRPAIDASGTGAAVALTVRAADVTVSSLSFRGAATLVRGDAAHRLHFHNNSLDVQVSTLQARHGIDVRNADAPTVRDNDIVGNLYPGSISIALRTVGAAHVAGNGISRSGTSIYVAASTGVHVTGNHLTVPSVSQFASESLGMSFFRGSDHLIHHNTVEGAGAALNVKGATDVTAHNDTYRSTLTGVRLSAASTTTQPHGLVLRDLDLAGTETALRFMSELDAADGLTVLAPCVDWGAYTRSTIETRIDDGTGTNIVLFQPWTVIEADGPRCLAEPGAAIGVPAGIQTRLGPVDFTDQSAAGSHTIVERRWDFGDGNTSTAVDPSHQYATIGSYVVSLLITDAVGQTDHAETMLVVANLLPKIDPIADRTLDEGATMAFTVRATDAEDDPLSLTLSPLPDGLTFVDHGDGTADVAWTPTHTQSGIYTFTLTADDTLDTNSTSFTVTVVDVNGAPVLAPIGPRSVLEAQTLTIDVAATDPDGEPVALAAFVLPPGAGFVDHGDGTGTFTWLPTYFQSGVYDLTFQATDGIRVARETIEITVLNVNRAPTLDAVADRSVQVGTLLSFFVSGQDPDGDPLTYAATALPPGASFDAARRLFTWTPTLDHVGVWSGVTFTVSDGSLSASQTTTITVTVDQLYKVVIESSSTTARIAAAGETILFDMHVANQGTSTRTYTLTAGPVPLGWNVVLNRTSVTLDPGQAAPVRLSVTPNDDHFRREIYVNATDALTQASLKVAVALPVTLNVVIAGASLTREIMGQVSATYHDGSPARHHTIVVIETPGDSSVGKHTTVSGDTNAAGIYSFRLPYDPLGPNRIGNHDVQAQYETIGGLSRGFTTYFVGTSLV